MGKVSGKGVDFDILFSSRCGGKFQDASQPFPSGGFWGRGVEAERKGEKSEKTRCNGRRPTTKERTRPMYATGQMWSWLQFERQTG